MIVGTNRNLGTAVPLDVSIVDGAGNQVTAFGGSGGTSFGDDSAFTIGSASSITPIGALCDEVATDSVDEGDAGLVRMTADRKLLMRLVGSSDANRADVNASGHLKIEIATDSVGIGGGTQYTEDAAAAANPVGTVPMLIRTDTPATQVSTDGDNIAQRATNYGAAYVQVVNSSGSYVDSFGGGTEYTEDAVAAANPVGKANILVRTDTPATQVSTDGDNIAQRGTNYGAAYVQIVTSAGAYVDSFGGGTQYTEDVASVTDPIGTQLIARRRDSLATETTTDGDNTAVNSTGKGELYVKHVDAIPVTDNAGSLTIDNTTLSVVGGGTEAAALRVTIANDSTGLVSIDDNGGSLTVDNAGTFAVQATIASGASSFVHLEDDASANLDAGAGMLAVRKATPANTSGLDGDYEFLQMSAGRLWTSATIDTALPAGTNNIGDVDVLTVPAPLSTTGNGTAATALRVTVASDSTGQITLAAGSASIGILGANSGVDIGDVTINNAAGASAVNIQDGGNSITVDGTVTATISAAAGAFVHLEDDASNNLDGGAGMLAVRKATPANTSGTDGDYEFLQMSAGRLWTSTVVDTALPTGSNIIGRVGIDQTTPGTTDHVSPISGQNGVAGGSGVVGATTQRVVLATDIGLPTSATATVTSVNDAATNQTLLSANTSRKGFCLFNDTTVIAYVKFGTTATTTDYTVRMNPLSYYELTGPHTYNGRIDCIWASDAAGAMKVTELT